MARGIVSKIVAGVLALAIVGGGVCAMGIGTAGFKDWSFSRWFPKAEQTQEADNATGGAIVTEGESKNMRIMSAMVAAEDYDEYGIDAQTVENVYNFTVTYTPANTTFQETTYSIAFANPSSTWATGKVVTDYATITQSAEGSKNATLTIVQPFGEQIIVTATSERYPDITATAKVDYVCGIYSNIATNYQFNAYTAPNATFCLAEPVAAGTLYSTGTITPDSFSGTITLTFNSAFYNYLRTTKYGQNALEMINPDNPKFSQTVTIENALPNTYFGLGCFFARYYNTTPSATLTVPTPFLNEAAAFFDGRTNIPLYTVSYSNVSCTYNEVVTSVHTADVITARVIVSSLDSFLVKATGVDLNSDTIIFSDNGLVE